MPQRQRRASFTLFLFGKLYYAAPDMTLSTPERRWAKEIGRALIPPETFGGARSGIDLGALLGEHVAASPWWTAVVVRAALWLVWLSPLLVRGRLSTFGRADDAEREALLEALLCSPLYPVRQTVDLLKLELCMLFMSDVALLRRLGAYDLGQVP